MVEFNTEVIDDVLWIFVLSGVPSSIKLLVLRGKVELDGSVEGNKLV